MTDTFPSSPPPSSLDWALHGNTQVFRSPLSGAVQTLELPGAVWAASLSFHNVLTTDAAALEAFLHGLSGAATSFFLWHHAHATPQGIATGTPLVSGAGQTGKTLASSGWTINQTGILKAGDMIAASDQLRQVTADVNSDGSGLATIPITPAWRTSPVDASAITHTKALGIFRLASPPSIAHTTVFTNIRIQVVETF